MSVNESLLKGSSLRASSPFDDLRCSDFILHTSDNVDFYVHRIILSLASPFFKDMFSLPQTTLEDEAKPVINTSELSKIIDPLLRLIYPVSKPYILDVSFLGDILEAAIKYDTTEAINTLKKRLRKFVHEKPLQVFAIACRLSLEEEIASLAAHRWREISPKVDSGAVGNGKLVVWEQTIIGASYIDEMAKISAGAFYRLTEFVRIGVTKSRSSEPKPSDPASKPVISSETKPATLFGSPSFSPPPAYSNIFGSSSTSQSFSSTVPDRSFSVFSTARDRNAVGASNVTTRTSFGFPSLPSSSLGTSPNAPVLSNTSAHLEILPKTSPVPATPYIFISPPSPLESSPETFSTRPVMSVSTPSISSSSVSILGTVPNASQSGAPEHILSPFNFVDSDLTVSSSDGVKFEVHDLILRLASPKIMSKVEVDKQGKKTLSVPENRRTVSLLLQGCYPSTIINGEITMQDMHASLSAAVKYGMKKVVDKLKTMLKISTHTEALRFYYLFAQNDLASDAAEIAHSDLLFFAPLSSLYIPEMEEISAEMYYHLLLYRHKCLFTMLEVGSKYMAGTQDLNWWTAAQMTSGSSNPFYLASPIVGNKVNGLSVMNQLHGDSSKFKTELAERLSREDSALKLRLTKTI